MFTIEQIKSAHARTKTGADFPMYVADLKNLGVAAYKTAISDGHTEYRSSCGFKLQSEGIHPTLETATNADKEKFDYELKNHQQGGSDFMTFCRQAASAGVEGWEVDLEKYTCTYFDKKGETILVEVIPQVSTN